MRLSKIQRQRLSLKIKQEIVALDRLRKVLIIKNPNHSYLWQTIENSTYELVNLLLYLEEANPLLAIKYHDGYFHNRQVAMHKSFISDLHIGIEVGLKRINKVNRFKVINHSKENVRSIVKI